MSNIQVRTGMECGAFRRTLLESRRAGNAVKNFCKSFDFDDPDKANTAIAFLVVCDMLLTGFDAPIEQVMYVDKRLKEHNLLISARN
jgi:type I restriction enzyme, R subunit